MNTASTDRRVVSVTMKQSLYDQLRRHCAKVDQPLTVFVREAIKQALSKA